MNYLSEVQSVFAQAQSILAPLTGGDGWTIAGTTCKCTVSAPNASQIEALGREMEANGWRDRGFLVLVATRAQFASVPVNAPSMPCIPPVNSPYGDCLLHSVSFEDPHHYIFIVVVSPRRKP